MLARKGMLTIALSGLGAISMAQIIDFEDLGVAPGTQFNPAGGVSVLTGGFEYAPGPNDPSGLNDLHIINEEIGLGHPSNGTTVGVSHDDVVLTKIGGGAFNLASFDFAGWTVNKEKRFQVTGEYMGGGTVSVVLDPDGICDGTGGAADFQTFFMDASWTNLVKVTWDHTGSETVQGLFGLDNINTGVVPEPATMTALALGAAGMLRRRRK